MRKAADHARGGGGPAIVEATCHRFRGHFEGDPDTYRDRDEKRRIRERFDPLSLYRARLEQHGVAGDALAAIAAEETGRMKAILADVRGDRQPDPSTAMRYNFATEDAR
jgi:pyruvate dehydrogenase E1 component alpha subunit